MYSLKYAALLLCILPWVSAGPVKAGNPNLRDLIKGGGIKPVDDSVSNYLTLLLENFRALMPTGIPAIGLASLDPFALGGLGLDIPPSNLVNITGYFEDITVTGLSTFQIDSVIANLRTLTMTMNISVPQLTIQGDYNLDGSALSGRLDIFGTGDFIVGLYDVSLYVSFFAEEVTGTGVQIQTLYLQIQTGSASVVMEDLLGGGEDEIIADVALSAVLLDLVNQELTPLLSTSTEWLRTELNLVLLGQNLPSVAAVQEKLPFLLSKLPAMMKF